jgi:hypothetical protein
MTATLTPALALAYLRELSTDIRAAVVLDAAGERLAGDEQLVAPARRLLDESAAVRSEPVAGGTLLVARAPHGPTIAVAASDRALLALLRHDLLTALEALSVDPPDAQ